MRIKVSTGETKEVEVLFPVYRRHDLDHTTIYSRTNLFHSGAGAFDARKFIETSIYIGGSIGTASLTHGEIQLEVKYYYELDSRSGEDYVLGKGSYASSQKEFAWAADLFKMFAEANLK